MSVPVRVTKTILFAGCLTALTGCCIDPTALVQSVAEEMRKSGGSQTEPHAEPAEPAEAPDDLVADRAGSELGDPPQEELAIAPGEPPAQAQRKSGGEPRSGSVAQATGSDERPKTPAGKPSKVVVYDNGIKMARTTMTLPPGWRAEQDIATNPQTGQPIRQRLDRYGPNGEVARSLGIQTYLPGVTAAFQPMVRQRVGQLMNGVLDDHRVGNLTPNRRLLSLPTIAEAAQTMPLRTFEAKISGTRQGKKYEGAVFVVNMTAQENQNMGTFVGDVVVAPEGLLEQTIADYFKYGKLEKPNLAFRKRLMQINQRAAAQSQSQHQQRMRQRQAAFDAHQRRMKGRSQAMDQSHQRFMQNNFGTPSGGAGGNGYDSHDAYIDSIHERNTFADPSTGQNVQMDGQNDYYYTDGQGNFYGTDDPSFDPNSLQGDWRETEPLAPEY